jgi:O-antigen/teichoic acid export membrane protein
MTDPSASDLLDATPTVAPAESAAPGVVGAGLSRDWRRGAVRNTVANGLGRIVALAAGFLLTPVILHAVGSEAFGLWVLIGSVVAYGSLANLGSGGALTKYIAEHRARGETGEARATIVAASRVFVLMGAAVGLVLLALAPAMPALFRVPVELAPLAQLTAALMAIGLGTGIALSTAPAVLRGLQRYDVGAAITAVTTVLSVVTTLIALALGWGIVGIAAFGILTPIVTQLLAAAAIRRLAPELAPVVTPVPPIVVGPPRSGAGVDATSVQDTSTHRRGADDPAALVTGGKVRRILGFSWPLLVLDIAGMLQAKSDEIVVGLVLSIGAVTPYALGRRLSAIPRMLAEQFAILLLPLAAALDAVDDRARLRSLYLGGVRLSLAIAMPLTGCLAILAVPILDAWVGPGFEDSAVIVVILAIATLIDLSLWPAGYVLQGINRHRWLAPIALGSGIANLALSLALIGPLGITGVALGTLIPTSLEAALVVTPFTLRALGISPARFVLDGLGPALLPVVPMVAVLWLAMQVLAPTGVLPLILLVALGHLVYGLGYLATGAAAPERRLARDLLAGLPPLGRFFGDRPT